MATVRHLTDTAAVNQKLLGIPHHESNGTKKLGQHLVAFLDVLGQRDKFWGLKRPTNPKEEAEVREVPRQTAGLSSSCTAVEVN